MRARGTRQKKHGGFWCGCCVVVRVRRKGINCPAKKKKKKKLFLENEQDSSFNNSTIKPSPPCAAMADSTLLGGGQSSWPAVMDEDQRQTDASSGTLQTQQGAGLQQHALVVSRTDVNSSNPAIQQQQQQTGGSDVDRCVHPAAPQQQPASIDHRIGSLVVETSLAQHGLGEVRAQSVVTSGLPAFAEETASSIIDINSNINSNMPSVAAASGQLPAAVGVASATTGSGERGEGGRGDGDAGEIAKESRREGEGGVVVGGLPPQPVSSGMADAAEALATRKDKIVAEMAKQQGILHSLREEHAGKRGRYK